MSCLLPIMDVPTEILPLLDTEDFIPTPPFGDSLPPRDNSTCDVSSDQQSAPAVYTVQFTVGFTFDYYNSYIDYEPINVYAPPSFCLGARLVWEAKLNHSVHLEVRSTIPCNSRLVQSFIACLLKKL